jgi:hypothetical protein
MIVTSCAQCSSSARSAKSRTAPAAKSAATIAAAADSGGNDRIHRREHRAGDIGTVEIGIKIAGMVYVAA